MHDLNTNLVADSMLRGRRSIYVDFVDYDAVAHHAGIMQPESLAALAGIDAVLAQLEPSPRWLPPSLPLRGAVRPRPVQGAIFADRYGEDLSTLVRRLSDAEVPVAGVQRGGQGPRQLDDR